MPTPILFPVQGPGLGTGSRGVPSLLYGKVPLGLAQEQPWRAGGRTFGSTTDNVKVTTPSAIDGLCTAGGGGKLSLVAIGKMPATLGTNQHIAQKSGAITTRGWTWLLDNVTVNGQMRVLIGGTTYWDLVAPAADVVTAGTQECLAFTFDRALGAGTQANFYRGPAQTPVAATSSVLYNQVGATEATDAGDALFIGNNTAAANPMTGDLSWLVVGSAKWTLAQVRYIQLACLTAQAGEWDRGVALMRSITGFQYATFIANDGTVTQVVQPTTTLAAISPIVTGTTAGVSLENNSSGTRLNQLHAPKLLDNDIEGADGRDWREQTSYRYSSGYANADWRTTATSITVWGEQTFTATPFGGEECIGVDVDNVYNTTFLGTGGGLYYGTATIAPVTTVQVTNGPRSRRNTPPHIEEPQQGTFQTLVYFNASAIRTYPPRYQSEVRFFTDSLFDGYAASPCHQYAVIPAFRRSLINGYDSVAQNGYGGAMMVPFTTDPTVQSDAVKRCIQGNPTWLVISLGINDNTNNLWTKAQFQSAYSQFLDALLAEPAFTGRILCYSLIITSAAQEANANVFGDFLSDYRTVIQTLATSKGSRVRYRNGYTAASQSNLVSDGIHLNNAGQGELLADVKVALSQSALTVLSAGVATTTATLTKVVTTTRTATANGVATTTVTLTAKRLLSSVTANGVATTTTTLVAKRLLSSVATSGVAATTAGLHAKRLISTAVAGVANTTATLVAIRRMTVAPAGVAATTVSLNAKRAVTTAANGIAATTAGLHAKRLITTSAAGSAITTVALAAKRLASVTTAGVATTTVTLTKISPATTVSVAGSATTTATLTAKRLLSSVTALGVGTTTVSLRAKRLVSVAVAGVASTTATLVAIRRMSVGPAGSATTTASLSAKRLASVATAGVATTTVALSVKRAVTVLSAGVGATTVTRAARRAVTVNVAASATTTVTGSKISTATTVSVTGVATTTAGLHAKRLLSAVTAAGSATTSVTLSVKRRITVAVTGLATTAVTLVRVASNRTALSSGVASVTASLTAKRGGSASTAGVGAVTVSPVVRRGAAVGPSGQAATSVTLNVKRSIVVIARGATTITLSPYRTISVAAFTGKYRTEHVAALIDLGAAVGFTDEHTSALTDVGAARGFSDEHTSALRDLTDAGV